MKISSKIVSIAGAFGLLASLSACDNVEPVNESAAQVNPDGDIEIYDVKSKQVLYTTDERLLEESDRGSDILKRKEAGTYTSPNTYDENTGVSTGLVVNSRGYTNSIYCDEKKCDVGSGIDSSKSYHKLDTQVETKPITTKTFDPF